MIRRVAEHLVGLIRPGNVGLKRESFIALSIDSIDFVPGVGVVAPVTPSDPISAMSSSHSPFFHGAGEGNQEEMTRLHQEYLKLTETNRK